MRLIDPNELEKILRPILTDESCPLHIAAEIDMNLDLMPKVDAVPVRHGNWINIRNENVANCDICGARGRTWMRFCHDCGARMDGKGDSSGRIQKCNCD